MADDQTGGVCRYNKNILCDEINCGTCGWNPVVSERRLRLFLKKNGISRETPQVRPINALEAVDRIRTGVFPMVEAGCNPWMIYVEVMKCLNASATMNSANVQCKDCEFAAPYSQRGSNGSMVCHNEKSPCNRRKVPGDYYCPCGERRKNGEKDY